MAMTRFDTPTLIIKAASLKKMNGKTLEFNFSEARIWRMNVLI